MADDIGLRLSTMIRAMQDAVLPALAPGNALAAEQGHLVLASLRLIADQHAYGYVRAMADLRDLHALVGDLDTAGEADEARAQAAALLRDLPSQAELLEAGVALRAAADRLIASAPPEREQEVAACVLDHAARDIARGRAWIAGAGFDPAPQEVTLLAELFPPTSGASS